MADRWADFPTSICPVITQRVPASTVTVDLEDLRAVLVAVEPLPVPRRAVDAIHRMADEVRLVTVQEALRKEALAGPHGFDYCQGGNDCPNHGVR